MNSGDQVHNTLWYCQVCQVWWVSEPQSAYRWRMLQLTSLENLALQLAQAPVWQVCGPSPAICPECGHLMIEQPWP